MRSPIAVECDRGRCGEESVTIPVAYSPDGSAKATTGRSRCRSMASVLTGRFIASSWKHSSAPALTASRDVTTTMTRRTTRSRISAGTPDPRTSSIASKPGRTTTPGRKCVRTGMLSKRRTSCSPTSGRAVGSAGHAPAHAHGRSTTEPSSTRLSLIATTRGGHDDSDSRPRPESSPGAGGRAVRRVWAACSARAASPEVPIAGRHARC